MRIEEAKTLWLGELASARKGISRITLNCYHVDIEHLVEVLENRGVRTTTAIGREDLEAFRDEVAAGYKHNTLRRRMRTARQWIAFLQARGKIGENPFDGLRMPEDQAQDVVSPTVTPSDARAVRGHDLRALRDRAILSVMASTGATAQATAMMSCEDVSAQDLSKPARKALAAYLSARDEQHDFRHDPHALWISLSSKTPGERLSRRVISAIAQRYRRAVSPAKR